MPVDDSINVPDDPTERQDVLKRSQAEVQLPARYVYSDVSFVGGMGVVHKAWDARMERDVAVKRILPKYLDDEELVARFHQEAKSLVSLTHPNIVTVYEFGKDDAGPYMVMQWLTGGSLKSRLESRGRLEYVAAAKIFFSLANGLAAAHEKGMIHRDIKPANILFDDHDHPILVDFGIVRIEDEAAVDTKTGGTVGTVKYMAPEQERNSRTVTKKSDVWSLGATLYETVVGKNIKGMRPDDIPAGIRPVVLKATENDPGDRFGSMEEFAGALEPLFGGIDRSAGRELSPGQCARCRSVNTETKKFCTSCGAALRGQCLNETCDQDVAVWEKHCGECGSGQFQLKEQISARLDDIVRQCSEYIDVSQYPDASRLAQQLVDENRPQLVEFRETGELLLARIERESKAAQEHLDQVKQQAKSLLSKGDFDGALSVLDTVPEAIRKFDHARLVREANDQKTAYRKQVDTSVASLTSFREQLQNGTLFCVALSETVNVLVEQLAEQFRKWQLVDHEAEVRQLQDDIADYLQHALATMAAAVRTIEDWPSEPQAKEAAQTLRGLHAELREQAQESLDAVAAFDVLTAALTEVKEKESTHLAAAGMCGYLQLLQPFLEETHHGFIDLRDDVRRQVQNLESKIEDHLSEIRAQVPELERLAATGKINEANEKLTKPLKALFGEGDSFRPDITELCAKLTGIAETFEKELSNTLSDAEKAAEACRLVDGIELLSHAPYSEHESAVELRRVFESRLKEQQECFAQFQVGAADTITQNNLREAMNVLSSLDTSIQEGKRWRNLNTVFTWMCEIQDRVNELNLASSRDSIRECIVQAKRVYQKLNKAAERSAGHEELVKVYEAGKAKLAKGFKYLKGRIPPDRVAAPFDLRTANLAQKKWARHLRMSPLLRNDLEMEFVVIPPGTYVMGSPPSEEHRRDNERQRKVTIEQPFLMGLLPVSERQRSLIEKRSGNILQKMRRVKKDDTSAVNLSYAESELLAEQLNQCCPLDDWTYCVPSEEQWECACRAGTVGPFNCSPVMLNCDGYGPGHQIQPGGFAANQFGLKECHGNVDEWCQPSPESGLENPEMGIVRGGSFKAHFGDCRSASRRSVRRISDNDHIGLRICCELKCLHAEAKSDVEPAEAAAGESTEGVA